MLLQLVNRTSQRQQHKSWHQNIILIYIFILSRLAPLSSYPAILKVNILKLEPNVLRLLNSLVPYSFLIP